MMEARATQQSLAALSEMRRQPSKTKVSPTSSPALHLPLTATTLILLILNTPSSWHDFASPNYGYIDSHSTRDAA